MKAKSWTPVVRVRLMSGMIASVMLLAGAAFAGHEQTAKRKIIVFREGTTQQVQQQIVEHHGHKVLHHLDPLNAAAIALQGDTAETALIALQSEPRVAEIHDDYVIKADHIVAITPVASPPEEIIPWGVEQIGVPGVIDPVVARISSPPRVAILDTGIDKRHPELRKQIAGGYNARAQENSSDYQDYNGHGTHVAGIIAAAWDGKGIIGTATHPELVAVKVLDDSGHGYLSDLIEGLRWVLEHDIRIVNMSLSFSEGSPLLEEIINQLDAAGVIMVASAGNRCMGGSEDEGADEEGGDSGCSTSNLAVRFPAAYPAVVAVVATTIDHHLTGYNRSGPEVDLAGPGGDEQSGPILSTTIKGGYGIACGSSQAAAHVSGAAAVALQLAPRLSGEQVVGLLKGTGRHLGYPAAQQGAGLVAVDNLVRKLLGLP
jgi:subtilisin family serine protease